VRAAATIASTAPHPGTVLSVDEWVLRERFATGKGDIAWDRLGEGPPVVLVHGTPWSSWTWRRIAPRLAERFSVYVFDLLGFGAPTSVPVRTSRSPATGLAWPRWSSTGSSSARR
jgi:pimeloyl-ACP methyl ester carboxylesterase